MSNKRKKLVQEMRSFLSDQNIVEESTLRGRDIKDIQNKMDKFSATFEQFMGDVVKWKRINDVEIVENDAWDSFMEVFDDIEHDLNNLLVTMEDASYELDNLASER